MTKIEELAEQRPRLRTDGWRNHRCRHGGFRHQFADQRPGGSCTARWRPIAPTRWPSRCRGARCPTRSTGTWPIPITTCGSIPARASIDYLIAGGADHKSGEADDGDVRFEAIEAWIRALVPKLGKEVTRWSGQVLDTIDYCGFIGRNPGSKNVFVVTGDSGQGMTHGALAGILLKDLIVNGSSPWEAVYDPARKTPAGICQFRQRECDGDQELRRISCCPASWIQSTS